MVAEVTSTKCSPLSEYGLALYIGGDFVVAKYLNKEFKKRSARKNWSAHLYDVVPILF